MKRRSLSDTLPAFLAGLTILLFAACSRGGQEGAATEDSAFGERYTYRYATVEPVDLMEDQFYQFLSEEFNLEIEQQGITWDDWGKTLQVMFSSGNMPDVIWADPNIMDGLAGINRYAEHGILHALPADLGRFPHMEAAVRKNRQLWDACKLEGRNYIWPRWISSSFGAYYQPLVAYRRDWAAKLGFDSSLIRVASNEKIIEMARAFMEMDPYGGGRTIGYATYGYLDTWLALNFYNPGFTQYLRQGDRYVWGPAMPETLAGIKFYKKMYADGILWKDFFAGRSKDAEKMFYTGQLGIIMGNFALETIELYYLDFQVLNPDLDAKEVIGFMIPVNSEGRSWKLASDGYWSCTLFDAKLEEKKLDRFLALMDWLLSVEGKYHAAYGIRGTDWDFDSDGQVELFWEFEQSGVPEKTYLSTLGVWRHLVSAGGDDLDSLNPLVSAQSKEIYGEFMRVSNELPALVVEKDYTIDFFDGPLYNTYGSFSEEVLQEVNRIVVFSEDVERDWAAFLESMRPKVQPVLEEINAALPK